VWYVCPRSHDHLTDFDEIWDRRLGPKTKEPYRFVKIIFLPNFTTNWQLHNAFSMGVLKHFSGVVCGVWTDYSERRRLKQSKMGPGTLAPRESPDMTPENFFERWCGRGHRHVIRANCRGR